MPKIITVSDIHGQDTWKQLDPTPADKIIFIGDYVDSYTAPNQTIYQNLTEIIALKQQYPHKVELLLGNHDIQYLYFPDFGCSGFRPEAQPDLTALFRKHRKLFTIAWQLDNYLFTHAGLTGRWWGWVNKNSATFRQWANLPLAEQLNNLNETSERWKLFTVGKVRGGFQFGGPLWADDSETLLDPLPGYHQLVGHTPQPDFRHVPIPGGGGSFTYVDVLQTRPAFYELTV